MRQWLLMLAIALAASLTRAAEPAATDEAPGPTTLAEMLQLGATRNPGIAAARARWQATIETIPQARSLPDPMVVIDYFGRSVETRVGPQEYRVALSQSFPWPGTLAQAGEVAAAAVRSRQLAYDAAIRDFIVELKLHYHELVYLRGAMGITAQNEALLGHILAVTNTRYAAGEASLNDVLKGQSQLAQLGYDLVLLRELEQVEIAAINALLDRPTETPIGDLTMPPVVFVRPTLAAIEAQALANRQEIGMAAADVNKAEEAIALAKLKNRPSFTVNASRIETGEAVMPVRGSGDDPWTIGVGVSIPIWGSRNRSRVREAEFNRDAAVNDQRVVENATRSQVKAVYFRLENARRLVELYEKSLIPQAAQAMAVAEQWNDGKARDVSGFLETQGVWLNFTLARLRAVVDYQQYTARMERLLGGPMPQPEPAPAITEEQP